MTSEEDEDDDLAPDRDTQEGVPEAVKVETEVDVIQQELDHEEAEVEQLV